MRKIPLTLACSTFIKELRLRLNWNINQFGAPAAHCWIYDQDQPICREDSRTVLKCRIPKLHLNVGIFYLRTYLSEPPGGHHFETLEVPLSFEVSIVDQHTLFGWRPDACAYLEEYNWEVI